MPRFVLFFFFCIRSNLRLAISIPLDIKLVLSFLQYNFAGIQFLGFEAITLVSNPYF